MCHSSLRTRLLPWTMGQSGQHEIHFFILHVCVLHGYDGRADCGGVV